MAVGTIKLNDRGRRVKRLQHGVAETLRQHHLNWFIPRDDGVAGHHTFKAVGVAAWAQGFPRKKIRKFHEQRRIGWWDQAILKHNRLRPRSYKKKARHRRHRVQELIKHHKEANKPKGTGFTEIDGRQVANWIAAIVLKVRKAGRWKGVIVSGFRTPEYSRSLCYAMCGAPQCSGRCAGTASNHACPPSFKGAPGEGAIDVSDYYTFRSELQRLGYWGQLCNNLPSDPVHFSRSGV